MLDTCMQRNSTLMFNSLVCVTAARICGGDSFVQLVGKQFVGLTVRFTCLPGVGMEKIRYRHSVLANRPQHECYATCLARVDRNMPRSNEFIIRLCLALVEPGGVISRMLLQAPV